MFGKYLLFGFLWAAESLSWPGAAQPRPGERPGGGRVLFPVSRSNEDKYCLVMIEWWTIRAPWPGHWTPSKIGAIIVAGSAGRNSIVPQICWAETILGPSWNWIFSNCFHQLGEYFRLWDNFFVVDRICKLFKYKTVIFAELAPDSSGSGQLCHNNMSGLSSLTADPGRGDNF